ncbi:SDR family oxidoreductase [Cellvibrio mixtus]|uniref:SDR family oxidoreductase n=1 Tax=Cellvibrio mixtus TaxID=39650 RepID=UPI0005879CFF|nr:SDR family oxidoreductase [Cellvibrio mixtus]
MRKSVLITGASTGIGYFVAHELKKAGYQVIASCRKQEDVTRLQTEGLDAVLIDLNDSVSIQTGFIKAMDITGGKLYALFNNGAYGQPGAVEDLSRETLRAQFETNVFGWSELTNLVLPVMLKEGTGRIIQNSSVLGIAAMPLRGAYNASKYAIEGLSDTLRLELKDTGVYVSLIEPGPIFSEFRKNALTALQKNIHIDNSRHKQTYQIAINRLSKETSTTPFTLGPDAVYKRVIHALESKQPQARYYVTVPTYLVGFMKRILPVFLLDKLLQKLGG